MSPTLALHTVALLLYAATAGMLGLSMARGGHGAPRAATPALALGVGAHGAALGAFAARHHELPLVGLGPSLSVLALLIALGSLVLALTRTSPLSLVLVPVAAALAAVAEIVGLAPGVGAQEQVYRGPWFVLHVVLAMVGYAGLTIAFAAGLMYLLQWRELKGKRFGAVFRFFPPLDTLDRIGFRALLAGLPFLTAALLLGWAWSHRFGPGMGAGNPKVVWGVVTWLVFVVALAARGRGARHPRHGAMASVIGFAIVVVAYLLLRAGENTGAGFL
ncbi:cytochrome C assembly family protein [Longimicrobium sp.]|jgi:ABC-type transport system involved in cytochrome c biogenesis permease subunit|uniref:cytochrome C assembly family protein n=1 Tax=Longimicrobium sp. TaxID=2029185 RepID=UPI002ED9B69D